MEYLTQYPSLVFQRLVKTGATSIQSGVYYGDGSQLTGIMLILLHLKDDDGNKVQPNPNGAVVTGITTLNGNEIKKSDGSETIARFIQDAAVKLHFKVLRNLLPVVRVLM